MKRFVVVVLLLGLACLAQKEFALPFKASADGVPEGWAKSSTQLACSVKDGTVAISGKSNGNLYISSRPIGLEKDVTYILSCEARIGDGGDCMIYYEYILDGTWKSFVWRGNGTGDWKKVTVRFSKQKDDKGTERVMLRLMNDTTLEVRNLKIAEENHNHGVTDSFPPSAPITRFIHNGSFEWHEKYWNILSDAGVVRSDDDYGNCAMRLGKGGFVVQQSIHLLPKRKYRVVWYGKAEKEDGALRLALRYMPSKELFHDVVYALKNGPYKRHALEFTTPDVKDPVMDVVLKNEGRKPLLLTQFYLKEFTDEETAPVRIVLSEPHYRDAIYATMPCDAIRGRVEFRGGATKAVVSFKGVRKAVTSSNPEFEFSAKGLKEGDHELTVTAEENGKSVLLAKKTIHKYRHLDNEITIGKDRNFYCDGKRFFPFLMGMTYEDPDKPVMCYLCATRGMTGRVGGGIGDAEAALLALERSQRFGLKTMLWIGGDFAETDDYEAKLRALLEKIITPEVLNHPALFAYNYCDEPWAREIPAWKFEAAAKIFRELDPYHPFFINESPRGVVPEYLADYAQYSDIYGVDLYPLPAAVRHSAVADKSMAAVGRYADIYDAASSGEKPVLMWLQGYQWHRDGSPLAVTPNAHELKFMCMDSLMHGTKAIMMFNHNMMKQSFYKDMFSVSGLVNAYENVISTGREEKSPVSAQGLLARSYSLGGDTFHLLLNETDAEIAVDVSALRDAKIVFRDDSAMEGSTLKLRPWGFAAFGRKGIAPKPSAPLTKTNGEFEASKDDFIQKYRERKFPEELSAAEWIWYPGAVENNPKVALDRELKFKKPVKSVIISSTADNYLKLSLDGRLICESGTWNIISELDVTRIVKPNGSLLHLEADNIDGPAALMLLVKVVYSDGTTELIGSDSSWDISNGKRTMKAQSFGKVGHATTWGWTSLVIRKAPKL